MVTDVTTDRDQTVYQRGECPEGNKCLFLTESQFLNEVDGQDALHTVIAEAFPQLHDKNHEEWLGLVKQTNLRGFTHGLMPLINNYSSRKSLPGIAEAKLKDKLLRKVECLRICQGICQRAQTNILLSEHLKDRSHLLQ